MAARAGPTHLYVYWRVAARDEAVAAAAARTLHDVFCREMPGLECELLRRVDDAADAPHTLMECYRHDAGVPAAWRERIESEARAALSAWLVGARHAEAFSPFETAR